MIVNFHNIELESSEDAFRPTLISEECALKADFKDKKVLDMGCGIGPLAIYFAKNGDSEVDACAISDLIVCRSGALTLAEITVCGKPSILIPFQFAAGDHQKKNAESLVKQNAAQILDEKTLTRKLLLHNIMNLIHNEDKLEKWEIHPVV